MQLPELLTVAEVAAVLRVCRQSVERWIAVKHLPALRVGRQIYRVRATDLARYLGITRGELAELVAGAGPARPPDGERPAEPVAEE